MFYLETRDDLVATATYQPEPAAVAEARRFVRDTLRSWDLTGYPRGAAGEDIRDSPGAPDVRPGTGTSSVRYVPGPTDIRVVPGPRDEVAARDVREVRGSRGEAKPRDVREMPSPEDGGGARGAAGARGRPGAPGALDALVDDAVLLTSELVTNAVLHAGTPVQVTCRLLADASTGGTPRGLDSWAVEIAVLDRRPALLRTDLPQSAAEAAERVSGRGLLLPAELASAWGVTYARAAKAVWFRMALPEPESEPAVGSCPGPGFAGQR